MQSFRKKFSLKNDITKENYNKPIMAIVAYIVILLLGDLFYYN